ncbi:MAG: ribosome-recycling factor [Isosphaeraceae bacterium]
MFDWKPRMDRAVRHLADQLAAIRPGTLSPGFLATFRVEYGGRSSTLDRLATIRVQGDRLVVTPFDSASVPTIVKQLTEGRLNAYAADPRTIAVAVPPISGEQREEIARHVKTLGEETRVAVRMIRQDARKKIAASGKGSERRVQEATDAAIAEIDKRVADKLAEIRSR